MLDAQKTIHLADYQPFTHLVERVDLTFRLAPAATRVLARLHLAPNPARPGRHPLRLDGEGLRLLACAVDGQAVAPALDDRGLTIAAEDLPDYPRYWFAESDAVQPPVTLWESVWDDRMATAPYSKIFQTCMLYARDLAGGRELMLALEMQPQDAAGKAGDTTHEIMVGIPLEMAEFSA